MAELQPSKLVMRVRFPSPAPTQNPRSEVVPGSRLPAIRTPRPSFVPVACVARSHGSGAGHRPNRWFSLARQELRSSPPGESAHGLPRNIAAAESVPSGHGLAYDRRRTASLSRWYSHRRSRPQDGRVSCRCTRASGLSPTPASLATRLAGWGSRCRRVRRRQAPGTAPAIGLCRPR